MEISSIKMAKLMKKKVKAVFYNTNCNFYDTQSKLNVIQLRFLSNLNCRTDCRVSAYLEDKIEQVTFFFSEWTIPQLSNPASRDLNYAFSI